ncbi:MAG: hypothetical protein OHK0022_06440 [Roseiflexaceae bacterium]
MTLLELLRERVFKTPEQLAYTFLLDGEHEEQRFSYAELDRQARIIGALLATVTRPGERALLLYPPGLDYIAAFFGCLYAGVIAVPAYPPNPARLERTLPRLQAIVQDAQPALALTTDSIKQLVEFGLSGVPDFARLAWHATDTLPADLAGTWRTPPITAESLAFLQYTSGSTATPKGVMLSHANLLHNSALIAHAFGHSTTSQGVIWLPPYHDMGLIGGIIQPLYAGFPVTLMSPVHFLQRPLRWLEAVSRYGATTSGGPNFAYDLCVQKTTPEQRAALDLSRWRVAFNGAEPIRAETMQRFAEAFAPAGFRPQAFYPCYGLAEATLIVSGGQTDAAPIVQPFSGAALLTHTALPATGGDATPLVSSGRALLEQRVVVADPQSGRRLPEGRVGEVWVAGPSVARGYWGRPDQTEATFGARLADEPASGVFLRTGDLGFLHDGELFVTGRIKDLIIIRGRNLYPSDLELTAERSHPSLRPGCGAAFAVEVEGEERVVIAYEVERSARQVELPSIAAAVRGGIAAAHDVQVYALALLKPGTIPKTSSGKIQRHACKQGFLEGTLSLVGQDVLPEADVPLERVDTAALRAAAPAERRALLERYLLATLALAARGPVAQPQLDQPLFNLGLDSLQVIDLQHRIEHDLGLAAPLELLLEGSGQELVDALLAQYEAAPPPAKPERAEAALLPLSTGQQALWFLHHLAPDSGAYMIAVAARLFGPLERTALEAALCMLVERHAALRTTFEVRDATVMQRIHPDLPLAFAEEDASAWSDQAVREHLEREARRPFDLGSGPLLRALLLRRAAHEHALLLTVHHLIADMWSLARLTEELGQLYAARAAGSSLVLAPVAQPADYLAWQEQRLAGAASTALWSYWRRQLDGAPAGLDLPIDLPRPAVQTFSGATHRFQLEPGLSGRLRELAGREGATLFVLLLAAFQTLLHRHTHQTDLVIGTPTAGRGSAALAGLFGYCVNPVALRARVNSALPFSALLAQARRTVREALAHQDLPFATLVERLPVAREANRAPLFQVMFALQQGRIGSSGDLGMFAVGAEEARLELGDLRVAPLALEQTATQFELTLLAAETEHGLALAFQYNTDLFLPQTIARMAEQFTTLLAGIASAPDTPLADLPLLPEAQLRYLLRDLNRTAAPYPTETTVVALIEAQAARTPSAPAVVTSGGHLSYEQLNRRANQLAYRLRDLGIGPEARVAICVERSSDLVLAELGVLKTGGAYVPLDPAYPIERLAWMLENCDARVLLTSGSTAETLKQLAHPRLLVIDLAAAGPVLSRLPGDNYPIRLTPEHLAYVIYTSGSTGLPKGVAVTHGGLSNLVAWQRHEARLSADDRLTQVAGPGFDATVLELWPCLTSGACLWIVDGTTRADPVALRDWMVDRAITVSFLPTPLAEQMLALEWPPETALRVLWTGGDTLRSYPTAALPFRLINQYGPTEGTVVATAGTVVPVEQPVGPPAIGRPVPNTLVYLLDERLNPVPFGSVGELYLGGAGVARGYLARPDLTAERFIPNPFQVSSLKPQASRLYRTGDLARWLPDGTLAFLGRADRQVKLRGFRIELGEIEMALLDQPGVADCAVLLREDVPGEKRLVAYLVPAAGQGPALDDQGPAVGSPAEQLQTIPLCDKAADPEYADFTLRATSLAQALRVSLAERLPGYMVPAVFVVLDKLPLTSNGKLDRRALPAPVPESPDSAGRPPRTPVEELLAGIWAELLGQEQVSTTANFFDLGGHSLLATRLIGRVRERLAVDLPLAALFERPTVADMAELVEAAQRVALPPLLPAPRDRPLPLSPAQRRLWLLDQFEPGNPAYAIPVALRLEGKLEPDALARALDRLVARHEVLRASFGMHAGEPVQQIAPALKLGLVVEDLRSQPVDARAGLINRFVVAEARRPFDLAAGPLLRARLLHLGADEAVLVLCLHHIIADGWSAGVLVRDLLALYQAECDQTAPALPALAVQYPDVAVWQEAALAGPQIEAQVDYWRQRLAGAPAALDLPVDHPRPPVQTFNGALLPLEFSAALLDGLRQLSRQQNTTLFMTLLAGFQALLQRWSDQDDIVVGTPVAGRNHSAMDELIGCFVNTLALRVDLAGGPTVAELLARVRAATLGAYANQDVPFERLVELLQPARDLSRTPLFQVMFALQNAPLPAIQQGGLGVVPLLTDPGTAKFDLMLNLEEHAGGLRGWFEYNTDLFDRVTVQRMAEQLGVLLAAMVEGPERRVVDLPLLTPVERATLLDWSHTAAVPLPSTIHGLVAEQAARTPNALALITPSQRLSYRELLGRAEMLARRLRRYGVGPELRVAVCLEREAELVVALLAVLIAGGAYVPIDPAYPPARRALMLEDSRATALISRAALADGLPPHQAKLLDLDMLADEPLPSGAMPLPSVLPDQLAYVIYTSGSTGRPKGVAISHAAAVARLRWSHQQYGPELLAGVLAATSVCFDLSVFELFAPLSCGGTVVLAPHVLALPELPVREQVTLLNTVPSAMAELLRLDALPSGLRAINLAGEPLPRELVAAISAKADLPVFNLYGPSEDTTYSTGARVDGNTPATPPIGRPLPGTWAYVLDRWGHLAPLGVPGELHLGGAGMARGYLGRPELTAERFVPNPFGAGLGTKDSEQASSPKPQAPRLYRTGDRVRWRADGQLEFLGRLDQQIKLRGFRIELGEVTAALRSHPAVETAVAVVRSLPDSAQLVAYVVPKTAALGSEPAVESSALMVALRAFLHERLPDYMVPGAFVPLEALPLTPNGKIDRAALPAPSSDMSAGYVAPRTELERQIAALWSRTLQREPIGVESSFFDLGGHSLLAVQVMTHVRAMFGIDLAVRSLFEAPTVAAQARLIEELQWQAQRRRTEYPAEDTREQGWI